MGVSNFSVDHVVDLVAFNKVTPQVNQIEIVPFHQQTENIKVVEA